MEIKSSLLKYNEFKHVKNSIIKVSERDDKQNFRVKLIEYINDTADNNDDMFFFDMLPYTRFLFPNNKSIAYTDTNHLIYLNSPGEVGEKLRVWDFIYCHECLHQLWDTFGVADKIKKENIEYNHELLNLASDCVINDFLKSSRMKSPFEKGIFPETLKEEFGIDYDRKFDTQFTLYNKLLDVYKEKRKEMEDFLEKFKDLMDNNDNQGNDNNQSQSNGDSNDKSDSQDDNQNGDSDSNNQNGQNGQNQGGKQSDNKGQKGNNDSNGSDSENGGGSDDSDLTSGDAKEAADAADKAAKKAQEAADKGKGTQEAADEAKKAAKEAADAADKSKKCADKGDKEGESKHAKEAVDAAKKAQEAGENPEKSDKGGGDTSKNDGNQQKGNRSNVSDEDNMREEEDADIDEIIKGAEEVINKYRNKLSGPIGDFLSKCYASSKLKTEGLQVNTYKGVAGWNTKMNTIINGFVKKKVFQKKRQYEKTYTRIKRGSGFVKFGEPIEPGRKIKEDKLNIDCGFYLDVSGSMGNSTKLVFEAVFKICEALKKQFGKEKVVDKTLFKTWAFNDYIKEIEFGKTVSASGCTMPFNDLLKNINKFSKEYLVNVIITDAQFEIEQNSIKDLLDKIDGIVLFITNIANSTVEILSKKYPNKLYYIVANQDFTLDK